MASVTRKRCPQCYRWKPLKAFEGKTKPETYNCRRCQRRMARGLRAPTRRGLDPRAPLRVGFVLESKNVKLGPIPVARSSPSTCPPSCSFFGDGCYAEFHLLRAHWSRVAADGLTWEAFCLQVAQLPQGQLWRYGEAGDLPGKGDALDVASLMALVIANRYAKSRGFTFTHKPLSLPPERWAIAKSNQLGFTVNLSAEGLAHADELAALGIAPVAAVVPRDFRRGTRTPAGRVVVLCPAETHGLTCAECELCSVATRKSVVAFRAHGQMAGRVSQLVQLRRRSA